LDRTQWLLAVVVAVVIREVSESIVAAVKNVNVTLLLELAVVVDIVVIVVAGHVISKTANVFVTRALTRALVELNNAAEMLDILLLVQIRELISFHQR
jgi:hypothetical protein